MIYSDIVSIGPGLPPSEGIPEWYIPETWQEINSGGTSLFSDTSFYCIFGNSSGGEFMVVWYFDDES
jgi:hypothetical protein